MRLIILAGYGPSLINFRGPLLADFVARGHQVYCCAPDIDPETERALHAIGCRVEHLQLARNSIGLRADLRYLYSVWQLCRRIDPDLAFAYTIKPVVYGLLAAMLAGVRQRVALITGLGYAFIGDGRDRRLVRAIAKLLYFVSLRFTQRVIFQNEDDRGLFVSTGLAPLRRTTVVSGSGIDLNRFTETPIPARPFIFLMIARLLRDKGVYEYVEAARCVRRDWPEARFQLLGPLDSNPAAVSSREVSAWQAEGAIEYLGTVSDVRPALTACSVYVLPSYREGTPRTVLEAMAIGRPILTTDAPGCRETVRPGQNGYLVPVKDARALAERMSAFLENSELASQMGGASRRYAEERYDLRKVNDHILHAMGLDGPPVDHA